MISVLLLMLGAQDPLVAAPAEVVAEEAALPLIVVRPVKTNSEAGQAAGHTGSVFVDIDMHPDGSRPATRISESSRSSILDAEALELLAEATLRAPEAATRYRIEVRFEPYGFLEMTCASLVRQTRWFEETWPEKSITDTVLFDGSVGMIAIAAMNGGRGVENALRTGQRVEAAWPRLVQDCGRQPNRLYVQVLAGLVR